MGSTVCGMPTVRIRRACNAARNVVSLRARSPASEWIARGGRRVDLRDGMLHFVDQRQHIAIITRVPYRKMGGEDETRGGLGNNAGFAAKLGRAIALAFANRRNSAIVGIDDFTRGQRFALGEAPRLVLNQLMRLDGGSEFGGQVRVLACGRTARRSAKGAGQTARATRRADRE